MTGQCLDRGPLTQDEMAELVARDIPNGSYVNLGIGRPTAIANHLANDQGIVLHTENGMLGMGPIAEGEAADSDLLNAAKVPVLETAGASYFDHAESFAMVRGAHLDICVLGAFQVSVDGTLANWHVPGAIPAVGGAMDLAIGARSVYVMMSLFTKDGAPKLVTECSYPITALQCVDRLYTDLAVFSFDSGRLRVESTFGVTLDELGERLGLPLVGS